MGHPTSYIKAGEPTPPNVPPPEIAGLIKGLWYLWKPISFPE